MANSKGHGARGFSPLARQKEAESLTAKEQRFIEEYLVDTDQTAAARRAGYSAASASTIACMLMKKPKIAAAIAEHKKARSEATGIDAKFVLAMLAQMATSDIADIVEPDGTYKPIHEWPKIWRQMLSGMDIEHEYGFEEEEPRANGIKLKRTEKKRVEVGRVVKLKFVDRLRVLELVGRHVDVRAFEAAAAAGEQHSHFHLHASNTRELEHRFNELTARITEQLAKQKAIEAQVVR